MTTSTDALENSTALVAAAFAQARGARFTDDDDAVSAALDLERMTDAELLTATDAVFAAKRQIDALAVRAAGELADRFAHDCGPHGIAAKTGNRNAAMLLTDVGQISMGEASRLCRVGTATRPRVSLLGERMPARYPMSVASRPKCWSRRARSSRCASTRSSRSSGTASPAPRARVHSPTRPSSCG